MPPRKKAAPPPAAAPVPVDSGLIAALAKEVADLEGNAAAKLGALESEHGSLQLALTEHRRSNERLLAEAARRLSDVEASVTGLQQHNKDHDIAAASRRAAVASRVQALESQVRDALRAAPDANLVSDDQLSQAIRNVWLSMAGLGTMVVVLAIKTFST